MSGAYIPHYKVFRSLTDNGSNMVKVYNLHLNDEEGGCVSREDELHPDEYDESLLNT